MNGCNLKTDAIVIMKTLPIVVFVLTLISTGAQAAGSHQYRTDLNPALLYWQAFAGLPELSEEERRLFDQYAMAPIDAKYEALVSRYDNSFRLIRRAGGQKQTCDWGIDLTDGPGVLLPHLAKSKSMVQAARVRARFFLEKERYVEAREDVVAAFVLGRNAASDGILVSCLVQMATESIVIAFLAENFRAIPTETLREMVEGLAAAPPRGTMNRCIETEKRGFTDWYRRQIEEIQARSPGDESKIMQGIRELMATTIDEKRNEQKADEMIQAGGMTSRGVLALLDETAVFYREMQTLTALPFDRFNQANAAFFDKVERSKNPWVKLFFPALDKVRSKEFGAEARLEMLRAALQYRLQGELGLKGCKDPFGTGPFAFRRFNFQNTDRGFELKSELSGAFPEVVIFVERSGPPFRVLGPQAGKSLENQ